MKCKKSKIFEQVRNRRFQTKSQASLFIILGIVLLILFGLFFSIQGKTLVFYSTDKENVKAFAESCLKVTQTCMMERMGENGANFVFDYGLNPLTEAKEELEDNIAKAAEICQNNFTEFKDVGIEAGNIKSEVSFNKKDTTSNTKQEIAITKGKKTQTLDKFFSKVDVRFSNTYSLAEKFMEENQLIGNGYINSKLLEKDEFNVNVYETENNQLITITDDLSEITKTAKYKFSFVK